MSQPPIGRQTGHLQLLDGGRDYDHASQRPVIRLKLIGGGVFAPDNFVPATRADCPVERPCPHVRCTKHLWVVDGEHRPGRRPKEGAMEPELLPRWLEWPVPPSCVIDEAQRRADINELPARIGIRKSSFFDILRSALRKLKRSGVDVDGLTERKTHHRPRGLTER